MIRLTMRTRLGDGTGSHATITIPDDQAEKAKVILDRAEADLRALKGAKLAGRKAA